MGATIVDENQTVDRRIARTRLAIRDALVALIKEKGFDGLTVKDIVDRANLNRGTFYLHYKDKFDLLDQTEAGILTDLQRIFLNANSLQPGDLSRTDQPLPLVIQLFEYVQAHADLMYAILGLQGDYSFLARIRRMVEQNLKLGTSLGYNADRFAVPREYLIAYILHANLGVIQAWLERGRQESPQEMARILFHLSIEGPVRATGLLNHPS